MMYVTESTIADAIDELKASTHPFLGITFLVCKMYGLPVGSTVRIKLDRETKGHLDRHHRLDPDSSHYFQPFKSMKNWLAANYASSGLHAINTRTFGSVFIHERGSTHWGFADDYIDQIMSVVRRTGHSRMPLNGIATWTGKDRKWPRGTTLDRVVEDFLRRYKITPEERAALFSSRAQPGMLVRETAPPVQPQAPNLRAIAHRIEPPPDAEVQPGTLVAIETNGVGPADSLRLGLGKRLTVVAGDNGLGKTFLLDVAWWAFTRRWVGRPATPFGEEAARSARISYDVSTGVKRHSCTSRFERRRQTWIHQREYPQVPAVYVYAGVDGAFSISDDNRDDTDEGPVDFTGREIWDGKPGRMEGLVRDWVNWQLSGDPSFAVFECLLRHLSPGDLKIEPAEPTRVPGDPRKIPVIAHPYGKTPVLHTSAGVRRIMALTYVVVWAWQEHLWASNQRSAQPTRRLVLIIDELDAHLHPFWQRTILPAILGVGPLLDEKLEMQIIASTHSPFVLASLETKFDPSSDALWHLRLDGADVRLDREEFHKRGDVSSWLTAPVFGLRHARSQEAELALSRAMRLQSARSTDRAEIQRVSDLLKEVLPSDDRFWRRWVYFAEQAGAKV